MLALEMVYIKRHSLVHCLVLERQLFNCLLPINNPEVLFYLRHHVVFSESLQCHLVLRLNYFHLIN